MLVAGNHFDAGRLDSLPFKRLHVTPPPGPKPSNEQSALANLPRLDREAGTAATSMPMPCSACRRLDRISADALLHGQSGRTDATSSSVAVFWRGGRGAACRL